MSESVLKESFVIPIYEFKTVDAGQRTIRIKGVALRGDVVSKNNRKYTREALLKATNTWIGKPVNVNHDDGKKVGTIKWMDYDEGVDALLYEAEITREPYISLLRNRSTEIKGLSIQADYLYNVCARCGKKFYTEEDWYRHVTEEEFMKDMPTQPHGILGTAISLVLSPEIPGYDGTTYELAEMARQATLRLLETVITEKKLEEEYKLSRIAIHNEGKISVGKSNLKEQENEHECGEGEHWDEEQGKCVPNVAEQEAHECPDGQHWDEEQQQCVANVAEQEHECPEGEHWDEEKGMCVSNVAEQEEHQCPEGEHWSEEQQACVPNEVTEQEDTALGAPVSQEPVTHECPVGQHWDELLGKCIQDAEAESGGEEDILAEKLKPFAISETAPKLKLGEPFAGYSSFEDCVAKNQDKDNPEAYCGQIKHEVEGEMYRDKRTAEKLNEVVDALNKLKVAKDDKSWVPRLKDAEAKLQRVAEWSTVKTLSKSVRAVEGKADKALLKVAKIKPYNDAALKKRISEIKPYNDLEIKKQLSEIKPYDDAELKQKVAEVLEKLPQIEQKVAEQKQEFDDLLAKADLNIEEVRKELAEEKRKNEELTAKVEETAESKKKTVEETADLTKRVENLEDKQKSKFKSVVEIHTPEKDKKTEPDLSYKPGGA